MANVGADVSRAIKWRQKKNNEYCQGAFFQALELLNFTITDPKNKKRFKELFQVREAMFDNFFGENIYGSSHELWHKYFFPFSWAARINR